MKTKRALRRHIEAQEQLIKTLEEQIIVLGDVAKIKDLTIQAIVGAIGTKVPVEEIEKIVPKNKDEMGPYL